MPRDALLLTEIIDAGERIVAIVGRSDPRDLSRDRDLLDALLWNYTVLGEAAGRISTEMKAAHPEVPWSDPVRLNTEVRALVAFSGELLDDSGDRVTEAILNGFPEAQTAKRFKGEDPYSPGDFHIMIVAEKFQTGFDEPYLHTVYAPEPIPQAKPAGGPHAR